MLSIQKAAAFAAMILPSLAVGAECAEATDASDLLAATEAVEEAWRSMDSERVEAAAAEANRAVACVGAPLAGEDVASYFRVRGYAEFLAGDVPASELSLLAARRIQPRYVIPDDLVVESHPLRKMFDTLAYRTIEEPTSLERPAEGELIVDGIREASEAPSDRPFVFQRLDREGAMAETLVAGVGEVPVYIEYTPAVFVDDPGPRPRTSRTLLIAGIGASVVGSASMYASFQVEKQWKASKECSVEPNCPGMVLTNQVLGGGGIAVTAAGAALGVGAVAVGRW